MRSWFLLTSAAMLSASCGGKASHKGDSGRRVEVTQLVPNEAFAEEYFIEDLSCMQSPSAAVHTGLGIDQSLFGFQQQDGKVVVPANGLKICDATRAYPRASVEGAAKISQKHLSTARQFYDRLPSKTALPDAALMVLPTVEKTATADDGTVTRTVLVDNLAYAPSFGGEPMFIVFPKSRRAVKQGLWTDVNLWEVPWGLAHEFGHHVFRQHTGRTGLELVPIQSFELTAAAGPTPDDYWTAVNEGFADLFAFYTHGAKKGQLRGVDCFETNRDVTEPRFVTGDMKILDATVAAKFAAPRSGAPANCDKPSFQDVHTLGAVIAHGMDQLFTANGLVDPQAKAEALLGWAERLGTLAEGRPASAVTLASMLEQALTDGRQCATARTYFPVYAGTWSLCSTRAGTVR